MSSIMYHDNNDATPEVVVNDMSTTPYQLKLNAKYIAAGTYTQRQSRKKNTSGNGHVWPEFLETILIEALMAYTTKKELHTRRALGRSLERNQFISKFITHAVGDDVTSRRTPRQVASRLQQLGKLVSKIHDAELATQLQGLLSKATEPSVVFHAHSPSSTDSLSSPSSNGSRIPSLSPGQSWKPLNTEPSRIPEERWIDIDTISSQDPSVFLAFDAPLDPTSTFCTSVVVDMNAQSLGYQAQWSDLQDWEGNGVNSVYQYKTTLLPETWSEFRANIASDLPFYAILQTVCDIYTGDVILEVVHRFYSKSMQSLIDSANATDFLSTTLI